jgi:ADP-ribose diphosphatase
MLGYGPAGSEPHAPRRPRCADGPVRRPSAGQTNRIETLPTEEKFAKQPLKMTETETLCNGKWLRLKRRGRWEFAERVNAGGGVIIVAVTPDDKLLLVEQYRAAIEAKTIEMPAGLVGDLEHSAGEHAVEAAHRELLEETGYVAGRIEFLMAGPSSSGMSNEIMAFVRAYDLKRVHEGGGDETEDIIVHEVPRADAARWLVQKMSEGYSVDPKMFAGLYFLENGEELFAHSSE